MIFIKWKLEKNNRFTMFNFIGCFKLQLQVMHRRLSLVLEFLIGLVRIQKLHHRIITFLFSSYQIMNIKICLVRGKFIITSKNELFPNLDSIFELKLLSILILPCIIIFSAPWKPKPKNLNKNNSNLLILWIFFRKSSE
jgi:hypothetical protein